jgi:cell wall-associated NlpC family hydrolase
VLDVEWRSTERVTVAGQPQEELESIVEFDDDEDLDESGGSSVSAQERLRRLIEESRRRAMLAAAAAAYRQSRRKQDSDERSHSSFGQALGALAGLSITIVLVSVIAIVAGLAALQAAADKKAKQNQQQQPSGLCELLGNCTQIPGFDPPINIGVPGDAGVPVLAAKVVPAAGTSSGTNYGPMFAEASHVFDVNPYLLASVAEQESGLGTAPAYNSENSSGCTGFMQIGMDAQSACGDTWDLTFTLIGNPSATITARCAYLLATTPVSNPLQLVTCPDNQYYLNTFDSIMAAAVILRGSLRGSLSGVPIPDLDGTAYQALCYYYGACADIKANYAHVVWCRAAAWQDPAQSNPQDPVGAPCGPASQWPASPLVGGGGQPAFGGQPASLDASTLPADLGRKLAALKPGDLAKVTLSQMVSALGELVGALEGQGTITTDSWAASSPNQIAKKALAYALSKIGKWYQWGGTGPNVFDCSGLVQTAYLKAGLSLPRTAQEQYDAGPLLPAGAPLQPGDLVFFGAGPRGVSHVGMVVSPAPGGGIMVEAPHTGTKVKLWPFSTAAPTGPVPPGAEVYVGATDPWSVQPVVA